MKKITAILIALLSLNFAQAATSTDEVLMCSFTEPFFTITYNANTKEVTYTGVDMYDELNNDFKVITLATKAQFVITPANIGGHDYIYPTSGTEFKVLDDKGDVLLTLILSYQGSDGMSDFIYPFDAVHSSGHVGGCYSKSAPLIDPANIYENLK